METTPSTTELAKAERRVAAAAILSFWLCSLVGQLLSLWWARRHDSLFVRRWAWLSLCLEGLALATSLLYLPVYFATDDALVLGTAFLVLWGFHVALCVATIPLAIRAWRGHDAASWRVPHAIGDRVPGPHREPNPGATRLN